MEDLKAQVDKILADDPDRKGRFVGIMRQLLRCPPGERLRKGDLADEFNVEKKTIQRDMSFFTKNHLAKGFVHTGGYSPEPRLFKLIGRLEKLDPEKYKFEEEKN